MMLRTTRIVITLLCAAASGCTSLEGISSALNPFSKQVVKASTRNPAVEVACIWQPGEGRGERGVPARGFSGQVYFFTSRNPEPVLVDGTMRIYLFADRGTPEERTRPLKQFDFEPAAWAQHVAPGSLGPGYSVFIPYPRTEAYQVRCQLRARFTPSDGGPPIWSEAVTMVLDGPPEPGAEPAWWTNVDRKSPPTVASFDLSKQQGTLKQLSPRETEESSTRTLRTDTFRLDAVRPVSYEVPAVPRRHATDSPRRRTAKPAPTVSDSLGILPGERQDRGAASNGSTVLEEQSFDQQGITEVSHPLFSAEPHLLSGDAAGDAGLDGFAAPAEQAPWPTPMIYDAGNVGEQHPLAF